MGLLGRMTLGGVVGGGLLGAGAGAYNARPGDRLRGAAMGGGLGAIGGGAAMRYGTMGARAGLSKIRSSYAQARGRWASRNNTDMFGPIQRSNAPVNSARDAVRVARSMPGTRGSSGLKRMERSRDLATMDSVFGDVLKSSNVGPNKNVLNMARQSPPTSIISPGFTSGGWPRQPGQGMQIRDINLGK
jgi:hypothetical protein